MTDKKARREAVHNLIQAHELLHEVYISSGKNHLCNEIHELNKSIEKIVNQIKIHIVEIVSMDGIDLNVGSPRYWDIVNDYINEE